MLCRRCVLRDSLQTLLNVSVAFFFTKDRRALNRPLSAHLNMFVYMYMCVSGKEEKKNHQETEGRQR